MENNNITKVGTPSFMSPEMLNVNFATSNIQFSDIWSLGIIFYTLAFGRMPFEAKTENELKNLLGHGSY